MEGLLFTSVQLCFMLLNMKKHLAGFIGLYLEFAIFTGLKTMIAGLHRLIGVSHLMKWDESKLADLLPKTGQNIADRKLSLSEIIKDIYWSRVANFYVWYCWSNRARRFQRKIDLLEDRCEALCSRFHQWFVQNRISLFLESAIQSARLNSDYTGLYYQNNIENNDIESIHASEKR